MNENQTGASGIWQRIRQAAAWKKVVAAVLVFPLFWQLDGIWFSIVAAEALSALVAALLLRALRGRYHYGRNPA